MNHPTSHRLLMRHLLLLAPLLVAATPSVQPLPLTDYKLGFESTPLEVKPGECVPITVQTQTLAGTGINLGLAILVMLGHDQQLGTFSGVPGCGDVITETLIPAGAIGRTVYYKPTLLGRVSLLATDSVLGLFPGASRPISVVASYTTRLEFTAVPNKVRPGTTAQVTVTAFDELGQVAQGYAGRVALTSNLPIPELPLDTTFEPTRDAGRRTFTLTFPMPGEYQLKIADVVNTDLQAQSPSILAQLPSVSVTPNRKTPGTCEATTFDLMVVEDQSLPILDPVAVKLCKPSGSPASLVPTAPGDDGLSECALRILQRGAVQQVTWANTQPTDVTFVLQNAEPVGDLTISWKRLPSPQKSLLSFPGTSTTVDPTLASYSQQLPVRFELRDTCGDPLTPPNKTFSFKATEPLFVTPASLVAPGVWTATVSLAGCPSSPSEPLLVQPAFDGTAVNRVPNEPFQLRVQPQCSEPSVELSLRAKEDLTVAEPGASVDFEVKLENKGTEESPQGVLKLSTDNLTLLRAEVDGGPVALRDAGATLPPLAAGKAVTVRITAEMPTRPGDSVRLMAMYTTPEGSPLTPMQSVILHVSDLSANVGCGSPPATLPSLGVAWLVLLLAASRPWGRSRRLRHPERIDRQSPW